MRKFKRIFLFGILALAICFAGLLSSNNNKPYNTENQTYAAETTAENPLFNYVTLSKNNQVLNTSNLKVIENATYVVGNGSTTITMQPFKYNYFIANTTNFIPTTKTIELAKGEDEKYPDHFKLNEEDTFEYYYRIAELTGELRIYTSSPSATSVPIVATSKTNVLSYYEDVAAQKLIISYVVSYTLSASAPDNTTFSFNVSSSSSALKTYSIRFLKPVVKFANSQEPIVEFTCNGVDAGPSEYVDTTIARENTYNSVNIEFLNNSYTEQNPLYFDINYNGFIYTFELYSKEYNSENLLFVNYHDETTPANDLFLATHLIPDAEMNLEPDPDHKIKSKIGSDDNLFSLMFNRTGRYQIDIYDSTYLTGMQSANYYSTSFYIDDQTVSAFENIYIISQTLDDKNKEIEYIVSKSTLNNSVKTTIKNINPANVESIIDRIEVQYTTFGGSNNIPTVTNYSASQVKSMLDKDNNLIFTFLEDAYYQIKIYQKPAPGESAKIIDYEFTVVKHAKTTFTIPFMDEDGNPYTDENGKKAETHTATKPFHTEIITYHKYIPKTMNLSIKFKSTIIPDPPTPIKKTFINNYTISYGMERVSIQQYERVIGDDEKAVDEINLRFYGVGTLTVQIKINGKTLSYKLNSEKGNNTVRLTEYGTYEVRLVDSMGTQTAQSFTLKKQLNISAIVLIILSVLLIAIIAIFILRARGKLATR